MKNTITLRTSLLMLSLALSPLAAAPALAADATDAAVTSPHSFTGNLTLASEYLYRGIAQTNGKPALQGGFDYAHSSGAYLGVWGSTISWLSDAAAGVSAPLELDLYGGYKNSLAGGDFNYDVGVLSYRYPGTYPNGFVKPDTTEVYGALGWKFVSLKYSRVVSSHIFGFTTPGGEKTRGSGYLDLSASHDLGGGWGINAHAGHQTIKGYSDASYSDYKIGLTKELGSAKFGSLGLTYSSTNAKGDIGQPYRNSFNRDLGDSRLVVSFTKTL